MREPVYDQPETEEQAAARVKCSIAFWILIVALAFMALGALLTKGHASVALDNAQKQLQYIVHTMPGVLQTPLNDMGIIVGPNFKQFSTVLDERLK
ncbi:hypothetical protein MTO96_043080, partial [Rhipicephalus appendiculatus]